MNNKFEAKAIHEASHYLEEKLNLFKKGGASDNQQNVYKLEQKKESGLKKLMGSFFK